MHEQKPPLTIQAVVMLVLAYALTMAFVFCTVR